MAETATEDPPAVNIRRRRRGRLGVLHGLWALLVIGVLGIAALSLTGAPFHLPEWATARIEAAMNARLAGARVDIGRAHLRFGADGRPEVEFGNVSVRDAVGSPVAQLNAVGAGLSPAALFGGRLQPRVIRLSGAQVTLRRDAAGMVSVSFGGLGDAVGASTPGEAVSALDSFLASGPMAGMRRMQASDITITLEDARSGRIWLATGGTVEVESGAEGVSVKVMAEVFNGTEDLAKVELTYVSERGSPSATLAARFVDAAAEDIALQSPALALLGLIDARISGSMRLEIDDGGDFSRLAATLDIGEGRLRPGPAAMPFEFDGARAEIDYDPQSGRIVLSEMSARTELVSATAEGHLMLGELRGNWPREVFAQVRASHLHVAPGAILERPLTFDAAFADLRVELDPFAVDVGQLALDGPNGRQVIRGRIGVAPEGWRLGLDMSAPEATIDQALALWPLPLAPGARAWLERNVTGGRMRDVTGALRMEPGERPVTGLSFAFDGAEVRAMRHLPPITGAAGMASLLGPRFALALSEGRMVDETGAAADLAGSSFVMPNGRAQPRMAEVRIDASARLDAMLRILDNPPFNLLGRVARPETFLAAQADAALVADVQFPMKPGLQPEDVVYSVAGTLSDLASEDLVPGRPLDATRIALRVTPADLLLTGPVSVGGVALDASFRRGLAPGTADPASVSARLSLTPETLAALGVALPPGSVTGSAEADLDLSIEADGAIGFSLSSDLVGAGLSVAALGWSKARDTPGRLEAEGRVEDGETRIDRLVIEAPGLSATGSADPGRAPGAAMIRFDRVQAGSWLDAPVTLAGRGPGAPMSVTIEGGRVNLDRRPTIGGAPASPAVPLRVSLDRLTIAEGLALAPFRGEMTAGEGLSGSFEARVNGGTPVRGTLVPFRGATAIRITAADGGAVLRDAGLYPNARGGDFQLLLSPNGTPGGFDGELGIGSTRIVDAPGLAALLDAVSVVGLLDKLQDSGILFDTIDARFELTPDRIVLREGAAVGASLGISMDGVYDIAARRMDMQGVVSPIYLINSIGQLLTRRGEGLFGFAYRMTGTQGAMRVDVNPLSILTPGMFREIFRRPMPAALR